MKEIAIVMGIRDRTMSLLFGHGLSLYYSSQPCMEINIVIKVRVGCVNMLIVHVVCFDIRVPNSL